MVWRAADSGQFHVRSTGCMHVPQTLEREGRPPVDGMIMKTTRSHLLAVELQLIESILLRGKLTGQKAEA